MESSSHSTYNVNLIVVVVLSSMSGVLSLILIVAIIRIKRQVGNCLLLTSLYLKTLNPTFTTLYK